MSNFSYRPPKEFGDRTDVGLGGVRALHQIPNLPFAKVDTTDAVAVKANGFDTVTKKPVLPQGPGRYVTEGRFGSDPVSHLMFAGSTRAKWTERALSEVGGDAGAMTLGVKRSVVVSSLSSTGESLISRSNDLATKTLEADFFCQPASAGNLFYVFLGHAAHFKDSSDNQFDYECCSYSALDGTNILPKVLYSQDGAWSFASNVLGYGNYDHFTYGLWQLAPNVTLVCHAVVARGVVFDKGARASTPDGTTPYPLFQISLDGCRTFTAISLDALFAGSTFQYALPAVTGSIAPYGTGGYAAVFGFDFAVVPGYVFISMELQVDFPSSVSYTTGGRTFEVRIFRGVGIGLDFTALAALNIPSGYGLTWAGAPRVVFANAQPGPEYGWVGYYCQSTSLSTPSLLYITADFGLTWLAPRYFPAISRFCVFAQDISTRELSCSVYEETTPPQVVRYFSLDFGLTWTRGQVIAFNCKALGPTDSLNDFIFLLPITPEDGSLPAPNPMSGWRFDSRLPKFSHG